uniref:Uncharacterized protein n=1 Tax=Anguilla anguilla TaxID=7936 RepID=A0A0E9S4H0_ANGAN
MVLRTAFQQQTFANEIFQHMPWEVKGN